MLVLHPGQEYLILFFGLGGVGVDVVEGLLVSFDNWAYLCFASRETKGNLKDSGMALSAFRKTPSSIG